MSIMNKILGTQLTNTLNKVGDIIDKISTTDEERLILKKEIIEIIKEFANNIVEISSKVIITEAQGSWLQRNWRPILMLAFGFIIIYRYFISFLFNLPSPELPEKFWDLLEIGVGGYIIGRSIEKISSNISNNFDKIPRK